ncbi:MAG: DNA polymerase I [Candidatus Paracaedimonas acanthamoebae]|uniref:DNA polymerase I n=1 Tax=Candidatus Paracaedimonas acanthamoebae TaxID=244581 RepID=A0A8J7PKZ4_9PROT|nr:DNA polymerase I [Candidatus Paracaedimonas acanthamoebae]
MAPTPLKHVYLIDGSGFIFRAFHGLPVLTRPDGTPVNAVLGFTNMLMKLLSETNVDHLGVIFDTARRNFRHDIYPDYKANRPPPPPELIPQFPLIREACQAFNVPSIELIGYEADDLIASYTQAVLQQGADVTIVSSDKDLMQLIGPNVRMFDPMKNKSIGEAEVEIKFGVKPENVVDVQALAGDSSDNIPGVPGIGLKTAMQLIQEFGSLHDLLNRLHEIPQTKRRETLQQNTKEALLSYQLVTLSKEVPLPMPLENLELRVPEPVKLRSFLETQNFRSLLSRLEREGTIASKPATSDSPQKPTPMKANYQLITHLEELQKWIHEAKFQGVIALDTETTSLKALQAELVGVSLALAPGKACYIPLRHKTKTPEDLFSGPSTNPQQIPYEKALKELKELLEDPSILKIGHNIKYDALILSQENINVAPYDDTMVLSYILDGTHHGHGLDELSQVHFDHQTIKYKEVVGTGKEEVTFDFVPLDKACTYAAEDADMTFRLYQLLKPRLPKEQATSIYETIDRPLIPILTEMEMIGITVNLQKLKELSQNFQERLHFLEQEIHQEVGHPFNLASPKQLGEVLFEELKLGTGKKGKSGSYGTGAEVLEDLANQGHNLPQKILDWRQLAKLKSTYTDALVEEINPHTGRVHTTFGMTMTSTGRLSSSNPNLQNIPIRSEEGRKIREAFVAKPGHMLISLDYSQIELRLLAQMANMESLKTAFRNGYDIHALTASEVFGLPLENVDAEHRRRAKAINFGIIYGISAFGLGRQLKISPKEAAHYIEIYNARYPGILAFMEDQKEKARAQGYVETLFGRKCFIMGIHEKNPTLKGFAERQAINAPLQGTAADIIKQAMIHLPINLAKAQLKGKMLLQVHDELILEIPETEVEATLQIGKQTMEKVVYLDIPLTVDTGVGRSWAEAS